MVTQEVIRSENNQHV